MPRSTGPSGPTLDPPSIPPSHPLSHSPSLSHTPSHSLTHSPVAGDCGFRGYRQMPRSSPSPKPLHTRARKTPPPPGIEPLTSLWKLLELPTYARDGHARLLFSKSHDGKGANGRWGFGFTSRCRGRRTRRSRCTPATGPRPRAGRFSGLGFGV